MSPARRSLATEPRDELAPCHRASSAKSHWTCPWTPENSESTNIIPRHRAQHARQTISASKAGLWSGWTRLDPRRHFSHSLAKNSFQNFECLLIYAQNSVKSIIPPWSMSIVLTGNGKKPCLTSEGKAAVGPVLPSCLFWRQVKVEPCQKRLCPSLQLNKPSEHLAEPFLR